MNIDKRDTVEEVSLLDILSGGNESNNEHLKIIQTHTLKLRTKEVVILSALDTVNGTLKSDFITGFLGKYIEYKKYNDSANKDLIKALQSISYKELMDKTQVGVRIGGN